MNSATVDALFGLFFGACAGGLIALGFDAPTGASILTAACGAIAGACVLVLEGKT